MNQFNRRLGTMAERPPSISRRALFRSAAVLAPMALLTIPPKVFAAPSWDGHAEITQRTGLWLTVPNGRAHHVMAWPEDSDVFPAPSGWVSADRTEIILKQPGTYRLDWRLTFNPGGGNTRKCASEFWDGAGWRDLGDANEVSPTKGDNETTLIGWAYCRSDGTNKVRILAQQDSGHDLRTSDRHYEAALHLSVAS